MHPRACVSAISHVRARRSPKTSRSGSAHGITNVGVSVAKLEAFGWDDGHRARRRRGRSAACASSTSSASARSTSPTRAAGTSAAGAPGALDRHRGRGRAPSASCSPPGRSRRSRGKRPPTRSNRRSRRCSPRRARPRRRRSRSSTPTRCASTSGFVHTLRDAIDLARRLDTGVCMELNACWAERGARDDDPRRRRPHPARAGERLQGRHRRVVATARSRRRRHPDRAHPRRRSLDAGYAGVFELELIGDAIVAEGYDAAVPRAVDALGRAARPSSAPDAVRRRSTRGPHGSRRRAAGRAGISRPSISRDPVEVRVGPVDDRRRRCTRSCTTHARATARPVDGLDDALLEHRGLALAPRRTSSPPTNDSPGQALALVEHVHLARRDHEPFAPDRISSHHGPIRAVHVRDAQVVEEANGRRVVQVTLRVEVVGSRRRPASTNR